MGRSKCKYTGDIIDVIKRGDPDAFLADHIRKCNDCRSVFSVHSWLTGFSIAGADRMKSSPPDFDRLWRRAFQERNISQEMVQTAMRPLKITALISRVIVFSALVIFFLTRGPAFLEFAGRTGLKNAFSPSFIGMFIRMLNSSAYISVPLSIMFVSILVWLLVQAVRPLTRKLTGGH